MKGMFYFLIIFCMASAASAEVSTRVCLADGNTPLELADPNAPFVYRDIMVGTRLTIIVDSNLSEMWNGGLLITGTDRDYGVLSARDYNDITSDWEGSRFEAAGYRSSVLELEELDIHGFDMMSHYTSVAGDWFIIDYTAISAGSCNVGFYDYSWPDGMDSPVYDITFSHVPSRDFNNDARVDFADFSVLASHWQETGCSDPNWCEGTDLDADGNIDCNDLVLFAHYWLEKTE
ncbi:MAG: hypothetical protein HQ580_13020 [Planctomycetes bacterium]|nr:hypothetical protein [Planctomycetota bacterium]